ncbi:hypothetical protein N0V91_007577 [Didymella pomorum]|uniref:Uncharacterized protein n=1 Tax=Didymella pomorum TaxID=749634 RepID=A0A9W9D6B1_9PLEO|nr:hypothetical protein N0V91_007577 [Didymella pomorum]
MALDHTSPVHGAADLWKRPPKDYELPAIRSAFDITWAFWDRATVGGNIQNLKYFHDCLVVNPDPLDLIRQAHEKLTPPRSAPGTWPGSPLGRSHGVFLIQHKEKLGDSKFISKIRVVKNDASTMLFMFFYIDCPSGAGSEAGDSSALEMMLQMSNGTSARLRAKL